MLITMNYGDIKSVTDKFPDCNSVYRYDDNAIYISGAPDVDTSDARVYVKSNSILQIPSMQVRAMFDLMYSNRTQIKEDDSLDVVENYRKRVEYELMILSNDDECIYDYKHRFLLNSERISRIEKLEKLLKLVESYEERFKKYYLSQGESRNSEFKPDYDRAKKVAEKVAKVQCTKLHPGNCMGYIKSGNLCVKKQQVKDSDLRKNRVKYWHHDYYEAHKEKWKEYKENAKKRRENEE